MSVYKVSTADSTIEWGLTDEERIVQNVLNILRTRQSEVPFMREMGLNPDLIDNNVAYVGSGVESEVINLVNEYEPRATILSVDIESIDDDGQFTIQVELEV